MSQIFSKLSKALKKTPLFKPLKYILAIFGFSTYPMRFSSVSDAEPFLERAKKRLGKVPEERSNFDVFYSYFSEIWPEGNELQLFQQYDVYMEYITKDSEHAFLDVGCGAGEFIDFLSRSGIRAEGVDKNAVEVERAKTRGLTVHYADAVEFLKMHEENYSGISMLQVIEHIPASSLMPFVENIYKALVPGGTIILETINTKHPRAFHTFYTDPTHTRPVPSDFLAFMLQWFGFERVKVVYTSPIAYSHEQSKDPSRAYFNYALIAKKPVIIP